MLIMFAHVRRGWHLNGLWSMKVEMDVRTESGIDPNGKGWAQRVLQKMCRAARRLSVGTLLCACLLQACMAHSQVNMVTYHNDVARTGQNTNETMLTPTNVNKNNFGFRFSQSVDGAIVGQPLYLSNVSISGVTHNVVYVATLHDSVYAFDADNNSDSNSLPLWQVNFTNPDSGITTASGTFLPCQAVTGYTEAGIVSTPVIDPNTGTMYVLAKTNENGTVFHRLHALDVTTGQEKFNSPAAITASVTANNGKLSTFHSLHQMNRPALLLINGTVYAAFGSNGCNDSDHGWVLAYDAGSLQQVGVFNTTPDKGLGSIWQSGSGPAADSNGNVYVSTAEAAFNVNTGGQDYGSSVLKLVQGLGTLSVSDYFTPYNEAFLSQWDLDLSSCGVVALPDQPGANPHLLVASGKQGTIYLLNRDNMGQFNSLGDSQIVQELPSAVGAMFSTPAYWNNAVYFAGNASPIKAFSLSSGLLATPPMAQSVRMQGGHAPTISANGNANGVLWVIAGGTFYGFDATTLKSLYNTNQAGTRDTLSATAHFATQTVANGRVYIGTKQNLMVYGLLPELSVAAGNNQSVTVNTILPVPLQVQAVDPYSGQTFAGVTVTFSDGGKGGTFSNSTVVTDGTGTAATSYTLPKITRTVTITASSPGLASTVFTETGTPGAPRSVVLASGNKQSAAVTTNLPAPVVAKVADQYSNGVPGVGVTFTDSGAGGSFSANPVTTNSAGRAGVVYTTATKARSVTITATVSGFHPLNFAETATAGPPAIINVVAGNNQTASPATQLPQNLVVQVSDQYGNPVPGLPVSYSDGGAGGSFSADPVTTDSNGSASVAYTAPPNTGGVNITATVNSLSATFGETIQ